MRRAVDAVQRRGATDRLGSARKLRCGCGRMRANQEPAIPTMKDQLSKRLEALRAELKSGQQMEADLQDRLAQLRATLLRISGAIQVLEELLGEENSPDTGNPTANNSEPTGAQQ
jgi:hypothetical protein